VILHLEHKSDIINTLGNSIGVHVRTAQFVRVEGRPYHNKLIITMDADMHPEALKILSDMIIMHKVHMYEFVGIEADVIPVDIEVDSSKPYQSVIKALFINKK